MITELRQLQDQGPTVPFAQIRDLIESELGVPLDQLFASFLEEPLSSASLGQVHVATLLGGREVIVKVLRPGVEELVESDLQVFQDAANLVDRQVPSLRGYDLPGFVRQFRDQIHAEMIYTVEAHNSERVRKTIGEQDPKLMVPEVIWSHTSRRVLTTERVRGRRVDALDASTPLDRVDLAAHFGQFVLRQIFVDGFFHGDPHQGNVLVTPEGRLAVLDWGIVGYLDPKTRDLMSEVLRTMGRQDVDAAVAAVVDLGMPRVETDLVSLRQALARIIIHSEIMPTKAFSLGEMLSEVIRAMSQQQIRTPMELSLAAKALIVGEGVATDLDPHFDFRDVVQPIVDEERARRSTPEARLAHANRTTASTLAAPGPPARAGGYDPIPAGARHAADAVGGPRGRPPRPGTCPQPQPPGPQRSRLLRHPLWRPLHAPLPQRFALRPGSGAAGDRSVLGFGGGLGGVAVEEDIVS